MEDETSLFQLLTAEDREYYWWRCEQMMCSASTPELLKVHLKVLYDKSREALDKHLTTIPIEAHAEFNKKFDMIFADKTASLTSLNIKSLQLCTLFSMILILKGKVTEDFMEYPLKSSPRSPSVISDFYKSVLAYGDRFFTFDTAVDIIKGDRIFSDLVAEGVTNVPICVILGELTMSELVESLAREVYLCGVIFDMAWADGKRFSPLEFLHHDILHMKNILAYRAGADTRANVLIFSQYLRSSEISSDIRNKCYYILFIIMHEQMDDRYLTKTIKKLGISSLEQFMKDPGTTNAWSYRRYRNIHDLGGLIKWLTGVDPSKYAVKDLYDIIIDAGTVFKATWNDFFLTKQPEFRIPNTIQRSNFEEKLKINSSIWNGRGGKRAIKKHRTKRGTRGKRRLYKSKRLTRKITSP